MGSLSIVPTINRWRSHTEITEHALNLFAVFGGVVNDLKHHDPGFRVKTILCCEPRVYGFSLTSCQCEQPFPAEARGLLQLGEDRSNIGSLINRHGQE